MLNPAPSTAVAVVLIGRNEGERFRRSLASAQAAAARVVYVDSGSTDGSVEHALTQGAQVVALDMVKPFTAARARNAGFATVMASPQPPRYVQFVDGDCELVPGWLDAAMACMASTPDAAVVFGRRRELKPSASVYNRLCDIEWDISPGQVRSCGGDALMRTAALGQVGGYRETLIAGEEPELCVRLRAGGWTIHCIGREMTRHDASITRFGQWWRRAVRGGHAFIEGHALHGQPPEQHFRRETLRPWFWAAGLPSATLLGTAVFGSHALVLLLAYPAQILRQVLRSPPSAPLRWTLPTMLMLSKFAELQGQLTFLHNRRRGQAARIIEYKS